jgi:hypothetical protein
MLIGRRASKATRDFRPKPPARAIDEYLAVLDDAAFGADQSFLDAAAAAAPNPEAVTDQEYPDHQLRIDRRSADAAVERRQLLPDLFKVDKPVDRPEQVVGWGYAFRARTHRTMQPVRLADVPS